MRIPSNKINDIIRYFKSELSSVYEPSELDVIIQMCFESFLNFTKNDLLLRKDEHISESQLLQFSFAVKDLKTHKPIQYILGEAHFYKLKFKVTESVLIPRPETEELVDRISKEYKNQQQLKVLDIGTGSGCIAIALSKNLIDANVSAIDVCKDALSIAKQNALLNNAQVNFIECDILAANFKVLENIKFDVIVSNPPYIALGEKNTMDKNVLAYEPHLALFVNDNDPLLFYKAIVHFAKNHLMVNGRLYFEINQQFGEETKQILLDNKFVNVVLQKDLNNNNRILQGQFLG
jgi:release factor glutamine methyltransferase